MRFKLLRGVHVEDGKTYHPGQTIDTERNLLESNQGSARFERLEDVLITEDASREYSDLEEKLKELSIAKLRRHAEVEGIDLGTSSSKEEVINTIRAAMQEA